MKLAAGSPHEVRVLSTRSDGRGGVVELPLLVETAALDLGRTASGTTGSMEITAEHLQEIVANFARYAGPVPIGAGPHVDFGDRGGEQDGFVEAVRVEGNALIGRLDLGPALFDAVVDRRAYRGFSVEMHRNLQLPTVTLEGWALTGGIFTNRPSLDVNFKVAAAAECAVAASDIRLTKEAEEKSMSDPQVVSLATHEAKCAELKAEAQASAGEVTALQAQVGTLRTDVQSRDQRIAALEADVSTAKNEAVAEGAKATRLESQLKTANDAKTMLTAKINEQTLALEAAEDANLGAKVEATIKEAIDNGVPPAMFDGADTAGYAAWLKANYANFEAFESVVATLRGVSPSLKKDPAKSGSELGKGDDPQDAKLTAEQKAEFERRGLSTEFVGVRSAEEARKIHEARQKTKE